MIFVWLTTFLFAPAMILCGEKLQPGVFTPGKNLWRIPFVVLGKLAARAPLVLGLVVIGLLGVSVRPLIQYARDPIEWDLRNLRSVETEPGRLWNRMDAMGMGSGGAGYIGSTGVLLVDTRSSGRGGRSDSQKRCAERG